MSTLTAEATRDSTLWRAIALDLEKRIAAGDLAPGERLPTEHEFADRFGVNRHTVRRALRDLQQRGLLDITQGRGSFVRRRPLGCAVTAEPHVCEGVVVRLAPSTPEAEAVGVASADVDIANALRVAVGEPVYRVSLIADAGGEPVALMDHFVSRSFGPTFQKLCRDHDGIDGAFAALSVERGKRGEARVRARAASLGEMRRLKLPKHAPTLLFDSVVFDAAGAPLEFIRTRFASDRVELIVELERAA